MNDPYRTLGVGSDASEKEIKKAFRALTQRYHPDKNPGDAAAEAKFKEVSQAYEVLGDADRRKHWDEFGEISLSQGFDPERARAYSRARGFGGRPGAGFGGGFGGGSPFGDFGGNAREASFDDLLSRLEKGDYRQSRLYDIYVTRARQARENLHTVWAIYAGAASNWRYDGDRAAQPILGFRYGIQVSRTWLRAVLELGGRSLPAPDLAYQVPAVSLPVDSVATWHRTDSNL